MSSRKAPEGPFPYPTTAEWAENLYEAIANTCAAEGFAPAPRPAVIEGLAPALGRGEASVSSNAAATAAASCARRPSMSSSATPTGRCCC